MQPIHQNDRGYVGERIDIHSVLDACSSEARRLGMAIETWGDSATHLGIIRRSSGPDAPNIYISAGVHGDEPAGPLSILHSLQNIHFPPTYGLYIIPCVNSHGFERNQREDASGLDLNRDYRSPTSPTTRRHIDWMRKSPRFDLSLCLHEDWEADGFYFYEIIDREDSPSFGHNVFQRFKERGYPMQETSVIEGLQAQNGQIRRVFNPDDMADWPEAFFIMQEKSTQCFTTETPSRYALRDRVLMQTFFIQQAVEFLDTLVSRGALRKPQSDNKD